MEFKSRTALAQHFKQLEKLGYVTSHWILTKKDSETVTKSKMFKINFDNVGVKNE